MKTKRIFIITILYAWLAIQGQLNAQQTETLTAFNETHSVDHAKILARHGDDFLVFIHLTEYEQDSTGTIMLHTPPPGFSALTIVGTDGAIKRYERVKFEFTQLLGFHAFGNTYAGVAKKQVGDLWSWPAGCNHMMFGAVDTSGLMDSSVTNPQMWVSPTCDMFSAYGALYSDGYYYILYQKGSMTYGNEEKALVKLSADDLSFVSQTDVGEDFHQAEVKPDNSGFYMFCRNAEDQNEFRLAELDLDGNISYESDYIDLEDVGAGPTFKFDGYHLYVRYDNMATDQYGVRKYDLAGNELFEFSTGKRTYEFHTLVGGLVLVQDWRTNGNADPLHLYLLDLDFSVLGSLEVGVPRLRYGNLYIDYNDGSYTIVGSTMNHPVAKDDLYFLHGYFSEMTEEGKPSGDRSGTFYPNPNQDSSVFLKLELGLTEEPKITSIQFHDMSGKIINATYRQSAPGLYEIDAAALSNGIYLGTALNNNIVVTSQLLVVKK